MISQLSWPSFVVRHQLSIDSRLSELPLLKLNDYGILCGGAIRRTIMKQPLDSDFDFFFLENEYEKNVHEASNLLHKNSFKKTHENRFAQTWVKDGLKVQLITKSYKDIESILDSFDFTICQFALHMGILHCGEYSLWDLGRRRLSPHKITYPLASMRRVIKYTKQGLYACEGCIQTIMQTALDNPNWTEIKYID
jgi:hypothetical protein